MMRPTSLASPFVDVLMRGPTTTRKKITTPRPFVNIKFVQEQQTPTVKELIQAYNMGRSYKNSFEDMKLGFHGKANQDFYGPNSDIERLQSQGNAIIRIDELNPEQQPAQQFVDSAKSQKELSRLLKFKERLQSLDLDDKTRDKMEDVLLQRYSEYLVKYPTMTDENGQEIDSSMYLLNLFKPQERDDGEAVNINASQAGGQTVSRDELFNQRVAELMKTTPTPTIPKAPPMSIPKAPTMTVKKENERTQGTSEAKKAPVKTEQKEERSQGSSGQDLATVLKQLLSGGVKLKKAPPKTEKKEPLITDVNYEMIKMFEKRRNQIQPKDDVDDWEDEEQIKKADQFRKRKEEERNKKMMKDAVKLLKEEFKKNNSISSVKKLYKDENLKKVLEDAIKSGNVSTRGSKTVDDGIDFMEDIQQEERLEQKEKGFEQFNISSKEELLEFLKNNIPREYRKLKKGSDNIPEGVIIEWGRQKRLKVRGADGKLITGIPSFSKDDLKDPKRILEIYQVVLGNIQDKKPKTRISKTKN